MGETKVCPLAAGAQHGMRNGMSPINNPTGAKLWAIVMCPHHRGGAVFLWLSL